MYFRKLNNIISKQINFIMFVLEIYKNDIFILNYYNN